MDLNIRFLQERSSKCVLSRAVCAFQGEIVAGVGD